MIVIWRIGIASVVSAVDVLPAVHRSR
jgi:hypothetical protein